MPEGSRSALHQGPMGEGKVNAIITSVIHALVIAAYELTSFMTWGFNEQEFYNDVGFGWKLGHCANIEDTQKKHSTVEVNGKIPGIEE